MTPPTIGDLLLSAQFAPAMIPYTPSRLQSDLEAGVASILAGVGADYRMWVDAANAKIEFGHKDLNPAGLGAGYSGALRSGLVINATGIAAGYNRQSDGAWVNALAISAAGDVTISGTLKAASIIEAGATVSGYGTIGTVAGNANQAAIDAAAAYSAVSNRLEKGAAYVMAGAFALKSTGFDAGNGVAITSTGILGKLGGVTKFSLDNAGNATFAGELSSATGTFAGSISTSGDLDVSGSAYFSGRGSSGTSYIRVAGSWYAADATVIGSAATNADNGGRVRAGVVGTASSSVSAFDVGVAGYAASASKGIGVIGSGGLEGGYFYSGAGIGMECRSDTGDALLVTGKMRITNSTLVTNLNADMLDGNHASAFATSGHTHSGYVSVAPGRSSGDYIYAVDFSAPSNPTTRAGWVRLATNAAGGGVWVPYYQ